MQPWFLTAYTATAPIMELCYDFHSAQAVSATADGTTCSFAASAAGDNGNINQIVNERNTNRSQNFTYDSLNRIQQAWTTGTNWGETFTIDAWGNLTNKGPVGGKTLYEGLNAQPASNKNQLNGYCHDAAGSLILNAGCPTGSFVATYSYDAENRMVSNPGASYIYDGDGNRVKKVGSTTTLYWYGAASDILTETDATGGTVNDYIFFDGQRVARRDATNIRYYFSDHLGSHSLITDQNGDMPPQAESDFYPYGGEIVITADSSNNHYKFTSKERDAETCGTMCLDNFGARHDASALGRFVTADPLLNSGHPANPQTWNRYAYALNSPTAMVDPNGLWVLEPDHCFGDDKCEKERKKQQQEFRNALAYLRQAQNFFDKKSREYKRIGKALDAYGNEGDAGVTVGFGKRGGDDAADILPSGDYKSFTITFDESKTDARELAADVGHEGTHVDDFRRMAAGGDLSLFSIEYRGYETSAFVFQGLNTPTLSTSSGTTFGGVQSKSLNYRGFQIWNTSWAATDAATISSRDTGITNVVTSLPQPHPETKPHNPWGD